MAVVIPMRAIQKQAWPSAQPGAEALPNHLIDWPSEQLWLSNGCWSSPSQQAMANAIKTAIAAVLSAKTGVIPEHELLKVLRYRRREVAWLRLAARVLRGPSSMATSQVRHLAASALFLAAVQHGDLLASVEFAAEVTGHAGMLEIDLVPGKLTLPPGIATMPQLAARMRRRGRQVLERRITWPDLDTIGPCLSRALAEDPLRGLSELTQAGSA